MFFTLILNFYPSILIAIGNMPNENREGAIFFKPLQEPIRTRTTITDNGGAIRGEEKRRCVLYSF